MKNLTKIATLLFAMILATGCGNPFKRHVIEKYESETRQYDSSNPVFASYIKSFEEDGQEHGHGSDFNVDDVPVNFGDTENNSFEGVCFTYANGEREILIRKSWWNSADEYEKKSLVYHELGHCKLNKGHKDEHFDIGSKTVKMSLMNHKIVSASEFRDYETEYLAELFENDEAPLLDELTIQRNLYIENNNQ